MATIQSRGFLNGLALFSLTDFAATYVSTISLWAAKSVVDGVFDVDGDLEEAEVGCGVLFVEGGVEEAGVDGRTVDGHVLVGNPPQKLLDVFHFIGHAVLVHARVVARRDVDAVAVEQVRRGVAGHDDVAAGIFQVVP